MESKVFEIRLIKSPNGLVRKHREVLKGMGLRKLGSKKLLKDTHQNRGMIFKMAHMLDVKSFNSESEYKKFIESLPSLKEKPLIIEFPEGYVAPAKSEEKKAKKAKDETSPIEGFKPKLEEKPKKKAVAKPKSVKAEAKPGAPEKKKPAAKKSDPKREHKDSKK